MATFPTNLYCYTLEETAAQIYVPPRKIWLNYGFRCGSTRLSAVSLGTGWFSVETHVLPYGASVTHQQRAYFPTRPPEHQHHKRTLPSIPYSSWCWLDLWCGISPVLSCHNLPLESKQDYRCFSSQQLYISRISKLKNCKFYDCSKKLSKTLFQPQQHFLRISNTLAQGLAQTLNTGFASGCNATCNARIVSSWTSVVAASIESGAIASRSTTCQSVV